MNIIRDLKINLNADEVLERLGYEPESTPQRVRKAVDRAVVLVRDAAEPRAGYERVPVEVENGSVLLDGESEIGSKKLRKVLGPCDNTIIFVTSLGPKVDMMIDELQEESMSDAYIADVAASHAAEWLADKVHNIIGESLDDEEYMTHRYSPGYCDWHVSDQKVLFGIVDASETGVALDDNCLMSPRKSVSGVIGVGTDDEVEEVAIACKFCKNSKCEYRREVE